MRCTVCGCDDGRAGEAHAQAAALAAFDLDEALEHGLLEAVPCEGCSETCNHARLAARDARHGALAARERYRAREERLQRRARARAAARAVAAPPPVQPPAAAAPPPDARPAPPLPPSVAAVLARAKQRASGSEPS